MMNSSQGRQMIGITLIAALAVYAAVVYWPPKRSVADDGMVGEVAEVLDELATLDLDPNAPLLSSHTAAPGASAAGAWPADPFHGRVSVARQVADVIVNEPNYMPARVYNLSAIMGGTNPLAMIDGRLVGVGDTLAGDVTVAAIDEFTVTLRGPHGSRVLKLPQ